MKKIRITPLSPTGEQPIDFYSWGDMTNIGIVSKREQFDEKLGEAFDSIEIKEDTETPETDYVLRVLGKEAGRVIIPFDMVVKDAYYDQETKEVVIVVMVAEGQEKEIRFSVADLIDVYTGDEVTIHVEKNIISITKEVMDKFDDLANSINEVEESVKEEERRAESIEKSLKDTIDTEVERAKAAEKDNSDAISKVEADYKEADETLKSELEEELTEKTKDMVEWKYSSEDRKHIVLGNHENVLGTAKDGGTYNLAMVSKWDVADFGSSQLHTNLNSKDGNVTINDDKVVATTEDVSTAVNTEKERAEESEKTLNDAITSEIERAENAEKENAEAISKVETDYKKADEKLEEELAEKTKNMVEWQYSSEDRKHIVLGNHENILGTATDGSTYNVAMVSKWNVVDLGSSQMPLNLNSKDGNVTINDDKVVATLDDVKSEKERAELAEGGLSDKIDGIELRKENDLLYALYVNGTKHGEINLPKDQFLKDISYDPQTKELIFTFETSDGEKVIRISIADLVKTYNAGEGLTLTDNVFAVDFDKVASNEFVDEKTKNMVEWEYSTEDRKHIVLDNHSNILGKSTDGSSYNLAMVSKWNVADFGSNQLHANLNSKDGNVTINDDKVVATLDDITDSAKELQSQIDGKADKEHTHEIEEVNNLQTVLDTKLNIEDVQSILKEQIYKLFDIDMIEPSDVIDTEMNDASAKYAIVGNGETISLSQTKSITAQELKITDVELYSESANKGLLSVNAPEISIENSTVSGSWNRSVGGNTMVSLNNTEKVSIKDVTFNRTNGYNAIEIGLDGNGTTETIVIDGLVINEKLSNNGINLFSFADNANVIIKNCHFTDTSNPIRISNATYAKNVNITIKDCTFDKWESSSADYAGLVLLQDYTSKTKEETLEKKPFETFIITIDNVTGPYGKINQSSTIEEICGSGIVDKQLIYVYGNKAGVLPYSEQMYPTIIIK